MFGIASMYDTCSQFQVLLYPKINPLITPQLIFLVIAASLSKVAFQVDRIAWFCQPRIRNRRFKCSLPANLLSMAFLILLHHQSLSRLSPMTSYCRLNEVTLHIPGVVQIYLHVYIDTWAPIHKCTSTVFTSWLCPTDWVQYSLHQN